MVQFFRPGKERGITAFADVGNNLGGRRLGFVILPRAAGKQPFFGFRPGVGDAQHSTILFQGDFASPAAFVGFYLWRNWSTTASSVVGVYAAPSRVTQTE